MIIIAALGLLGAAITGYLVVKSRRREEPVCPFGHSCAFVLHSKYNNIVGVRNEYLGFAFSVGVIIISVLDLTGVAVLPFWLLGTGFVLAGATSLFLVGVQIFVLRAYCSWCIASAVVNEALVVVAFTVLRGG